MPTVSTGRGTGTRKVKKASAWAGSKYRKAQKKNVGRTISTGRGTGTRKITDTKSKAGKKRKPSIRSGRGYVSR